MSWIFDSAEWVRKLRDDLSNYVIHFTKNAGSLSGKDVLLKILNDGEIKPSFAEVNGSNGVKGPHQRFVSPNNRYQTL